MSFDRNEPNTPYGTFRTSLDIGMGVFYIIIGGLILYARYFGTVELPASYAYILGGLMIAYGIFRIYRGLIVVLRKRKRP